MQSVVANAIWRLDEAKRAQLGGRLRAEAEALEALKGVTGDGGLPIAVPLLADGLADGDARLSVALMDNDWHEYRERGYERLRPSTANKRVPALIEGYVLISQFSGMDCT